MKQAPTKCKHHNRGYCDKRKELWGNGAYWDNPCILRNLDVKSCPDFKPKDDKKKNQ